MKSYLLWSLTMLLTIINSPNAHKCICLIEKHSKPFKNCLQASGHVKVKMLTCLKATFHHEWRNKFDRPRIAKVQDGLQIIFHGSICANQTSCTYEAVKAVVGKPKRPPLGYSWGMGIPQIIQFNDVSYYLDISFNILKEITYRVIILSSYP